MPAQVVIAAYRPKPGREKDLEEIVRKHVPLLRKAGLATARPVTLLRSFTDGTLLEIFEWVDVESAQKAHTHPEVSKLWDAFADAADMLSLGDLCESKRPFPHFQAVEGVTQ